MLLFCVPDGRLCQSPGRAYNDGRGAEGKHYFDNNLNGHAISISVMYLFQSSATFCFRPPEILPSHWRFLMTAKASPMFSRIVSGFPPPLPRLFHFEK